MLDKYKELITENDDSAMIQADLRQLADAKKNLENMLKRVAGKGPGTKVLKRALGAAIEEIRKGTDEVAKQAGSKYHVN